MNTMRVQIGLYTSSKNNSLYLTIICLIQHVIHMPDTARYTITGIMLHYQGSLTVASVKWSLILFIPWQHVCVCVCVCVSVCVCVCVVLLPGYILEVVWVVPVPEFESTCTEGLDCVWVELVSPGTCMCGCIVCVCVCVCVGGGGGGK